MLLRLSPRALIRPLLHRWKRLLVFLLLSLLFIRYLKNRPPRHIHFIEDSDIHFASSHKPTALHGFLPLTNRTAICRKQKWRPYPNHGTRRKVYDLFMLNDELDWLEIHLDTMEHYVDFFVIVESPVTFTGLSKSLILKENWERFKKWHYKIIYHVLENRPLDATRTWDWEDFQRNAMFLQTFPYMPPDKMAKKGDVIIVADVDEIPRPATLMLLRNCDIPRRVTIRSRFYYYSFQNLHVGEEWPHPQATTFGGFGEGETILPADLRNGEGGSKIKAWGEKADLWNAAWHCSTCFDTIEMVLSKMRSFSHTGLNQEAFRDRTRIVDRVRKGMDLWDREGEIYQRIEGNDDMPDLVREDKLTGKKGRWGYLLNRDGSNAAFKDYGEYEDAGD